MPNPSHNLSELPALIQRQSQHERRMDAFEGELKDIRVAMDRGFQDVLTRLDAREQRHGGEIKGDIEAIRKELKSEAGERKELEKIVQARGRTHWPTVLTAMGLMLAIVGAGVSWVRDNTDSKVALLTKDDELMQQEIAHGKEIRVFLLNDITGHLDRHDAITASNASRIATLEAKAMQNGSESEGRYNAINGRVDSLKQTVADLYEEVKKRPLPVISDPERGPKHSSDVVNPQR